MRNKRYKLRLPLQKLFVGYKKFIAFFLGWGEPKLDVYRVCLSWICEIEAQSYIFAIVVFQELL